ncbi:MAG: IS5 family transposase [Thermoplasmata archaeon]|jgi:IS5 family transposase|nr:IS5 family transposase [Thermoplasmata archaeon]
MKVSFDRFILKQQYQKVKGLGDRLELMKQQIDWKPFIPLVKRVFQDNDTIGGRPHTDELVVVRSMLLQAWYGLSDPELEFQCLDRLSFRNFLGYPENIPDFSTIWRIRDRLKETGVDKQIWDELQRQLDAKGFEIKKGMIQDAAFIEADLGKKRYHKEKKARKKGETIEYTEKQLQHMDKDGSFSVKQGQVHYGYKSHIKLDIDRQLIRKIQVTTASVHDSEVDLADSNDVIYRDRGYTGKQTKAKGNGSMKRGNLTPHEILRNKRISRKRAPGERPFSVVKRVFHGDRTQVKTLGRVRVKETFKYFAYDLYQLVTLERKQLAVAR